ncbi:MAG: signal peptidase II [Chthoniobacterales bacterium]|nr:signal peptidase II [Chthoniobacterales bacterium]
MKFLHHLFFALSCFVPLYLLDQITKYLIVKNFQLHQTVEIIPGFFNIILVFNTGAAFGIGRGANEFFLAISTIALLVVVGLLFLYWDKHSAFLRLCFLLLLPGIAGNLTDRIIHGHVIDFLDFIIPFYGHWPAFNIADSLIFLSAIFLLASAFCDNHRNSQSSAKAKKLK